MRWLGSEEYRHLHKETSHTYKQKENNKTNEPDHGERGRRKGGGNIKQKERGSASAVLVVTGVHPLTDIIRVSQKVQTWVMLLMLVLILVLMDVVIDQVTLEVGQTLLVHLQCRLGDNLPGGEGVREHLMQRVSVDPLALGRLQVEGFQELCEREKSGRARERGDERRNEHTCRVVQQWV